LAYLPFLTAPFMMYFPSGIILYFTTFSFLHIGYMQVMRTDWMKK